MMGGGGMMGGPNKGMTGGGFGGLGGGAPMGGGTSSLGGGVFGGGTSSALGSPPTAGTSDPVKEAEAAVKALREAKDKEGQRRAAEALEKAMKKLREQLK
jgi:hypothetical protein